MSDVTGGDRGGPALSRRGFLATTGLAAAGPAVGSGTARAAGPSTGAGEAARLLAVPEDTRGVRWIRSALQVAVALELATIPPYLCAWWSIRDRRTEAARLIRGVIGDEMYHMGLACNLLVAVGGRPRIATAVPDYPGPLPGGVRPGLTVYLSGLTRTYVHDVMMAIERPESPLARQAAGPVTIGAFYTAVLAAFHDVRPSLSPDGQLSRRVGADLLEPVTSLDDVERAIETVKEQGEGTSCSPDTPSGHDTPAHYYAFGEIYHGRRLRAVDGCWEFTGAPVPLPEVRPMGVVPAGGWPSPPSRVRRLLTRFDQSFGTVVRDLQDAWSYGGNPALDRAVKAMRALEEPALELMDIPLPDHSGTYGPQFRISPRGPHHRPV
ncbi:ferritin-like domain-containing protein [Kitasatospora sp. HPMI-4]|uniref:ferritin-like domain-containing protein n=1 Tax=Kitasatospora sp. HPMI-4 TaxID=3448443 RepID=UPI003F1BEF82